MPVRDEQMPEGFPARVVRGFEGIIRSKKDRPLLQSFRYAFDHRQQFRWLEESNSGGLMYALAHALGSYAFPPSRELDDTERHPIDRKFIGQLRNSVRALVQSPSGLEQFTNLLEDEGQNPQQLDTRQIRKFIARGLEAYSRDPDSGTSLDPW